MNPISELFIRHFLGISSPDDDARLHEWADTRNDRRKLFDRLADRTALAEECRLRSIIDSDRAEADMLRRIAASAGESRRVKWRIVTAAAAVAAAVIVAALMYVPRYFCASPDQVATIAEVPVINTLEDIKAGRQQATLSDNSGHAVTLDASSGNATSARLLASVSSDKVAEKSRELCLDVPRGGEFRVMLDDSTQVWLNSQSVLYYPEEFGSTERRVRVKGEAYFEVTHENDRPFYVEAGNQVIRVYGTKFNVRDYDGEEAVFTTLESGSIGLSILDGPGGEIRLSPGHQSVLYNGDTHAYIRTVDSKVITGWRHGRFVFEEQPLSTIMRDLSRWYDFDYVFVDPDIAGIVFMGSIPRYTDFATAAQIIENCGDIRFEVDNGKVIVTRKQ